MVMGDSAAPAGGGGALVVDSRGRAKFRSLRSWKSFFTSILSEAGARAGGTAQGPAVPACHAHSTTNLRTRMHPQPPIVAPRLHNAACLALGPLPGLSSLARARSCALSPRLPSARGCRGADHFFFCARTASTLAMSSVTMDGSASVDTSPSWSDSLHAILRSTRLMILPERLRVRKRRCCQLSCARQAPGRAAPPSLLTRRRASWAGRTRWQCRRGWRGRRSRCAPTS